MAEANALTIEIPVSKALLPDPGPIRPSRSEVHDIQRGRLLRAMAQVVSEKGYLGVAVSDVVAKASVSRRTFYEIYDDKEACFVDLVSFAYSALTKRLETASSNHDKAIDLLERVVGIYLETLSNEPEMARVILVDAYGAGQNSIAQKVESAKKFEAAILLLIEKLKSEGEIESEVSPDVEMIVGAIRSLVTMRVAVGETNKLPELRERIVSFICNSVGMKEN
ncbi:MAG: TetR/AcrR family transcriptional regulator [Acidimicrobiales bacterium]|nr:TetR/AcrR family transcriptional regulator [Acidimicrobiales bacterium]